MQAADGLATLLRQHGWTGAHEEAIPKHEVGAAAGFRPPINLLPEGPFMSFMSVALGEREVQLYSHRLQAAPPAIHFAVLDAATSLAVPPR